MSEEKQPLKIYGPAEAAKYLGIPQPTLARLRREGKVQGQRSGTTTIYLQQDLDNADLSREKPGPKTGPNSRLGRARYEWSGDKGTGENKSLDYTGKTDSENSDNFSNRWRPSLKEATDARQLVGA